MANVTDSVFRKIIAKYGKPDVMWTEFVSADGLVSAGKKRLLVDLEYSEKERPIVAQLFTGHPEAMKKAAELVAKMGFDGLDINMGCPDRSVEKQGGGAAMIKDFKKAVKVLKAAREGVAKGGIHAIPISVKTRLGYNKVDFDWIKILLEQKLPALTVHLRTRKEMSNVAAHWELMPEIIKMRNEISPETLIIGNGDVETLADGISKCEKYGCDGVMIGRGIFGTPWFFGPLKGMRSNKAMTQSSRSLRKDDENFRHLSKFTKGMSDGLLIEKSPTERLKILLEHTKLFEKTYSSSPKLRGSSRGVKNFNVMKKHFKAYVSGWDGAKELRAKLMETKNAKEVERVIKDIVHN